MEITIEKLYSLFSQYDTTHFKSKVSQALEKNNLTLNFELSDKLLVYKEKDNINVLFPTSNPEQYAYDGLEFEDEEGLVKLKFERVMVNIYLFSTGRYNLYWTTFDERYRYEGLFFVYILRKKFKHIANVEQETEDGMRGLALEVLRIMHVVDVNQIKPLVNRKLALMTPIQREGVLENLKEHSQVYGLLF
jgi:hypothetical protein